MAGRRIGHVGRFDDPIVLQFCVPSDPGHPASGHLHGPNVPLERFQKGTRGHGIEDPALGCHYRLRVASSAGRLEGKPGHPYFVAGVFQQEFCSFYLDTPNILTTYPQLNEKVQNQIDESFQVIKNLHYLSIGMGQMKPEPEDFPGIYDQLVRHIMIHNHFWFAHSQIRGEKENLIKKGLESLFSLTYPYLTEKGIEEYKEFINAIE